MRQLQEREHERRLAEAADRLEAETKRNRFFTLALDMLAIAGFDGLFSSSTRPGSETLGFSDEELKARPFLEFVHPDDREATAEHLERGCSARFGRRGRRPYFENRFACKAGGYRWLGWTAAPFAEEGLALHLRPRPHASAALAEEERVKLIREQTARAAAEASERRAAFLAEAGDRPGLVASTTGATLGRAGPPGRAHPGGLGLRRRRGEGRARPAPGGRPRRPRPSRRWRSAAGSGRRRRRATAP